VPTAGCASVQSRAVLLADESARTLHATMALHQGAVLGPRRATRSEPGLRCGMPPTHAESVVSDTNATSSDVRERGGMRMTTSMKDRRPEDTSFAW
jgi:hypothetical protein